MSRGPSYSRPAVTRAQYPEHVRALLSELAQRKAEPYEAGQLAYARYTGSMDPADQRLLAEALRKQAALDSGTSLSAIASRRWTTACGVALREPDRRAPEPQGWERELQQHDEAIAAYRENERATFAPYEQALAVWETKAREAATKGEAATRASGAAGQPVPDGMLLTLTQARQQHVADETKVLRAIADVVVQRGYERERELLDQAAPHIAELVKIASELRSVQLDLGRVRDARHRPVGRRRATACASGRQVSSAGTSSTLLGSSLPAGRCGDRVGPGAPAPAHDDDGRPVRPSASAPEPEPRPPVVIATPRHGHGPAFG